MRLPTDPERLARFEREAKVLASLNQVVYRRHLRSGAVRRHAGAHPGTAYERPTLQDRIAQGPIPLDEALPIARQIAEALEAAYEHGMFHRDLKPANVKVKAEGTVKVLDFGLAKALEPELSDLEAAISPTMTATTKMGVTMPTAAYHGAGASAREDGEQARRYLGVRHSRLRDADEEAGVSSAKPWLTVWPGSSNGTLTTTPCLPTCGHRFANWCAGVWKKTRESASETSGMPGSRSSRHSPHRCTTPTGRSTSRTGSGANAVSVLEEQENRRCKAIEAYKIGGLITVSAGIGIVLVSLFRGSRYLRLSRWTHTAHDRSGAPSLRLCPGSAIGTEQGIIGRRWTLTPGTTLGVYEVLSAIGAGGMGEVYKARDTKLVLNWLRLKILPDAFVNDPERLARFQRDA